ncbi:MAG: leucyl aminopeptidase [Chlorobi bacterium]|nr:leucyl aminopeptidase [Chlorobiota bacterium]
MVKCTGAYGTPERVQADVHTIFLPQENAIQKKQLAPLEKSQRSVLSAAIENGDFTGKTEDVLYLYGQDETRLLIVGVGEIAKVNSEILRRAAAKAVKVCRKLSVQKLALYMLKEDLLPKTMGLNFATASRAIVEGAFLGLYQYDAYKKKDKTRANRKAQKEEGKKEVTDLVLATPDEGHQTTLKQVIEQTTAVVEAVYKARDLGNAPSNDITPEVLAKTAMSLAKKYHLNVVVLKKKEIESHKMAGLLAVNKGSANEPRFIILEHNASKKSYPCVVIVGKGVTFDTGGISIKPSANMAEMKMDMAGAATVIGVMMAAARLKLPIRLIGLIPATDNMPSGNATCPGDIITYSNGVSVEIDNTDAEGRLILADALLYAQRFKPRCIIDLATLTGACVIALGAHSTGMMGTDESVKTLLKEAGDRTYERVTELPIYEEYEKQLKSEVADIKNVGGREAGAITAALFLKKFVGEYSWVHLDIAGTAMLSEAGEYTPKGASGVGVRLLVDALSHWKKS